MQPSAARAATKKRRALKSAFSPTAIAYGQWEPKNQRPELWSLYNGRKHQGEHFRVFPLSNWTEADIWQYIYQQDIAVPALYFAHRREVFDRDQMTLAASPYLQLLPGERVEKRLVRFRTIGDMTCTGAVESTATTVAEIIAELAVSQVTERGTRADDRRTETAMEDRKKQGYF